MTRTTKMYSNRDYTLYTTRGHCIRFKKGEAKNVPRSIEDEAMRVGILPVQPDEIGTEQEDTGPRAPETQSERDERILMAIQEMINDNNSDEFGSNSMPKIPALSKRAGFKVDATERDRLWEQATATGEPE